MLNLGGVATRTFWGPTTILIEEMVEGGVCGDMDSPLNRLSYPHFVTWRSPKSLRERPPGLFDLKNLSMVR